MRLKQGVSPLIVLTLAVWLVAPAVNAQRGMYDPKAEITVKGTVEEVQQMTPSGPPPGRGRMGAMGGTHIKLATGKGTYDVHLGPSKYLAEKQFTVQKGDAIEVTGSVIKIDGRDALIAREVTKGNEKLLLRDANGIPLWSGSKP
jgi:DNA/RNA endonuclease YhcR with UshA esterase domain